MSLALYLHIPFCVRKCPYCDFYSLVDARADQTRYATALLRELAYYRALLPEREIHSIHMGGGTPSILQGEVIVALLEGVRRSWRLSGACEITLEANPESFSLSKLALWKQAGVNRLSIGVQALDDDRLQRLQRPHDVALAWKVLEAALVSMDRVSVDLIYGTPGHRLAEWRRELEAVVATGIGHVSCYGLTLEPGTAFHRRGLTLPGEEESVELFRWTRSFLAERGLSPYEISNFARPGQESRHNLTYWEYGDYLGIGAAAHGKWTLEDGTLWRSENPRDLRRYLTVGGLRRDLGREEAGRECLMMGLRLTQGLSRRRYQAITGRDLVDDQAETVGRLQAFHLLQVDSERVSLTEEGVPLADAITRELF
ncbi:MAG: radical SAM family heme chaperone HemW [Magnetococcales bacterium]|nr:radical SAM family heme chaperone HemW [Magnetococcales bacterium]